jgi:hypothetical protein
MGEIAVKREWKYGLAIVALLLGIFYVITIRPYSRRVDPVMDFMKAHPPWITPTPNPSPTKTAPDDRGKTNV